MDRVNPVYISPTTWSRRLWSAGTEGDLGPLERLLDAVTDPLPRTSGPGALRRCPG